MYSRFAEIITNVDTRYPNEASMAEKISALDTLERQIYREIVVTHDGADEVETFITGDGHINYDDPTIAPDEFHDMYEYYVEAIIAQRYGETARYNNAASAFNTRYNAFQNYWNRTHTPLQKAGYLKVM